MDGLSGSYDFPPWFPLAGGHGFFIASRSAPRHECPIPFFWGCVALAVLEAAIPVAFKLADTLIGWLVWRLPHRLFSEWHNSQKFRNLSPTEQSLRRASHGLAYMLLPPVAFFWLTGSGGIVGNFIGAVAADPVTHWLPIAAAAPVMVIGLVRLIGGWRRSAGIRDGMLAGRAFIKLAIGGGLVVLFSNPPAGWDFRRIAKPHSCCCSFRSG